MLCAAFNCEINYIIIIPVINTRVTRRVFKVRWWAVSVDLGERKGFSPSRSWAPVFVSSNECLLVFSQFAILQKYMHNTVVCLCWFARCRSRLRVFDHVSHWRRHGLYTAHAQVFWRQSCFQSAYSFNSYLLQTICCRCVQFIMRSFYRGPQERQSPLCSTPFPSICPSLPSLPLFPFSPFPFIESPKVPQVSPLRILSVAHHGTWRPWGHITQHGNS